MSRDDRDQLALTTSLFQLFIQEVMNNKVR